MAQVMLEQMAAILHLERFSQLMAAVAPAAVAAAVMAAAFYLLPTLQQVLDSHCQPLLVKIQANLTGQGRLAHLLALAALLVVIHFGLLTQILADARIRAALVAVLAVALVLAILFILVLLADLMLAQLEVALLAGLLMAAARRVLLEPLSKGAAAVALAAISREQWLAEMAAMAVLALAVAVVASQLLALTLALAEMVETALFASTLGKEQQYALCNY